MKLAISSLTVIPAVSVPSLNDTGSAEPGSGSTPSRQEILSRLQKQEVTVTDKVSTQASFSSGSKGSAGIVTFAVLGMTAVVPAFAAGILLFGASPAFAASAAPVLTLTATPNPSGNYVALTWSNREQFLNFS